MVLSMGTWSFRRGKELSWGGKITREWKIQACETVCFLGTKQGVWVSILSFQSRPQSARGRLRPLMCHHHVGLQKRFFPSPPYSPRWLQPGTNSTKPTNLGGLMLWLRKINSSQTKAERDSRDGSGLDLVLPPSKNILLNTESDNNPAVTTASSNASDTGIEEV